jgi:RNA polymerase sigma factor (sigma-70 family)
MDKQKEQNFIQILDWNKDQIYRICKIYAVSPIEPQDLFQEVVFQIWKSLPAFKGKSNINTWIYKITLNVCFSSKKKLERGYRKTVQLESIEFKLSDNNSDNDQPERYKALRQCISSLKESHQSLIILHLEELSYKEIAKIIDLTENNIAVKMKRIRKILLNCITPKLN